jgi:hypothetical protein
MNMWFPVVAFRKYPRIAEIWGNLVVIVAGCIILLFGERNL